MKDSDNSAFVVNYRDISDYMMNGIIEMIRRNDGSFEITYANDAVKRTLFGEKNVADDELTMDPFDLIYPADRERVRDAIEKCSEDGFVSETYRVVNCEGKTVWVLGHLHMITIANRTYFIIIHTNVSELMGTQEHLQHEGDRLLDIVNSIPMGIAIFRIDDKGQSTVISINDQMVYFADAIGNYLDGNERHWTKEELTMLFNQSIYAFCDNNDIPLVSEMLEESKKKNNSSCIFRLRGSNEKKQVYIKGTCFSKDVSEDARNYYITFENVTKDRLQELELIKNQEMLYRMSYYDALTQVKNRNSYNEIIKDSRENALKNVGLMFADINGLKKINDVLGHKYGDDMIVRFANILKKYFVPEDIYRISGDEFVVVCSDIPSRSFNIKMGMVLNDVALCDSIASVGYIWEEKISNIKRFANKAEQIMYVEKQRYYEIEKKLDSKHKPLLLSSLLSDFDNGRFKMFLQPKADVCTSEIIGAEALVRKLDENGKIVPPYEFIPQLESERLIPKIDFYMLEETCRFLQKLKKKGKTDLRISVNMSRVTLVDNNFIQTIDGIIGKYDFNIGQLEFEITESNETMDNKRLEEYIRKIKERGIAISIDDVGTDYSSLTMLMLEGIDCVKFDRSLVIKLGNPKADMVLSHIVSMCRDMNLEVIAEGVETEETLKKLRDINCDSYQGYLLSRPIPADEFMEKYIK